MRWLKNIVQKRFLGRLLEEGSRSGGCLNVLDLQAARFATTKLPDTGKNDRTRGRVYTRVGVEYEPENDGYAILLDRRTLKTPALLPLILPSRALALAVASEWEYQESRSIKPFTMPMMSLAATAIDQPKPRVLILKQMLSYLHTDSVVCRVEPGPLHDRQCREYDHIIAWADRFFETKFVVSDNIFGSEQSPEAVEAVSNFLASLDDFHFAAAEALTSACRSVLVGLAVLKGELGVQEAISTARLEETYQLEEWGFVEGGHDIDIADIKVRITAPSLFVRLLEGSDK